MTYSWSPVLWLDDLEIEDHSATGLARMIAKYRGSQPRLQGFLEAFLDQAQSIEDVAFDVLVGIWPLTAIGDQLDILGKIVGQSRGELVDSEYRIFILGRIFVNRMNGTIPEFYELLEILGTTTNIIVDEGYPAYFRIDCVGCTHGKLMGQLALDGAPAGVDMLWVHSDYEETEIFTTASTPGADEVDAARGTENLLATTGGYTSGASV